MLKIAALILGTLMVMVAKGKPLDYGSDDLLKSVPQRIGKEIIMTDPFWTNTMIPLAVCLAILLLIVSIFAVSLIAIGALNEPEPTFVSFTPPGFDALWERNIQAELGMGEWKTTIHPKLAPPALNTIIEEDHDIETQTQQPPAIKFAQLPLPKMNRINLNIPSEPPIPQLATNSKTGLHSSISV